MKHAERSLVSSVLFPAVAMSLGWGLRGFIGGGPIGAMIPGALVALVLCLLLNRRADAGLIAAWGALGIALGGQMTYGLMIGFVSGGEHFWWGLYGITVKGAVWGLAGGAVLGAALIARDLPRRDLLAALFFMAVGTAFGWAVINKPMIHYLTGPTETPRAEIWAGLLAGGLFFTGYLLFRKQTIPASFAFWGVISGGLGFGGGSLFMALGKSLPAAYQFISWWKLMELTFGFLLGAGLGWACYLHRRQLRDDEHLLRRETQQTYWIYLPALLLILMGIIWLQFNPPVWNALGISFVIHFSLFAALLMGLALYSEFLAWHLAISLTACAFFRDLKYYADRVELNNDLAFGWGMVMLLTTIVVWMVILCYENRRRQVAQMFLLLMWSALLISLVKSLMHGTPNLTLLLVQSLFVVEALVCRLFLYTTSKQYLRE